MGRKRGRWKEFRRNLLSGLGLGLAASIMLALAVAMFVASVPWLALIFW